MRADVRSAAPLSADEVKAIEARLGARDRHARSTVDASVDPALIGGVIAKVGSTVYDGSVKTQLEKLRKQLVGRALGLGLGLSSRSRTGAREPGPDRAQNMDIKAEEISKIIRDQIGSYAVDVDVAEVGSIISIGDGIARVHGVENAMAGEMLEFPHGVFGIALNLEEDSVGAVLLGEFTAIKEGDPVKRTGRIISVPVGDEMLGRVVNALGQPIDGKGPIAHQAVLADRAHRARRRRSPAGAASRCRPASRPSTRWCRSAAASAS